MSSLHHASSCDPLKQGPMCPGDRRVGEIDGSQGNGSDVSNLVDGWTRCKNGRVVLVISGSCFRWPFSPLAVCIACSCCCCWRHWLRFSVSREGTRSLLRNLMKRNEREREEEAREAGGKGRKLLSVSSKSKQRKGERKSRRLRQKNRQGMKRKKRRERVLPAPFLASILMCTPLLSPRSSSPPDSDTRLLLPMTTTAAALAVRRRSPSNAPLLSCSDQ